MTVSLCSCDVITDGTGSLNLFTAVTYNDIIIDGSVNLLVAVTLYTDDSLNLFSATTSSLMTT